MRAIAVDSPSIKARAARTAARTAALYRMVTATHQVLLHATDELAVMQGACDLAVQQGGFRMAWIGIIDPSGSLIKPSASAGAEGSYLTNVTVLTGTEPQGMGPTGTAARSGRPVICNDVAVDPRMAPWREAFLARGFRSSAAFPLTVEGRVIGAFNVYSPHRRHFGRLEVEAVDELTTEIGYAINALRVAQQKKEAERALADSEARLRHLNEELERRVAARTAELEASNKELDAFAYSVSHDLRAPLRVMSGFARLFNEKYGRGAGGEAEHFVQRIDASAIKMTSLIDELLRFSRVVRADMEVDQIDPTKVAQIAIGDLRQEAEQAGVEVVLSPLPPCRADPGLLQQVYANLVSNAIKFSAGRPGARVDVSAHEDNETVYDVIDNGVGFDMRYSQKLFGVFQRLHSEAKYQGTGVGLALVQRIIHRHGGRVWAEAEPDKGATFHFTLGGTRE